MTNLWLRSRSSSLLTNLFVVILAGGVLAGCASTEPVEPVLPVESEPVVPPTPEPEPPEPVGPAVDDVGVWLDRNTGRPLSRVFLFDFDQATLSTRDLGVLEQWADFLRTERGTIVIEGHCDERGTREYNLALGERRSDAVRSFLTSAGVRGAQIDTVSYGEERPSDPGHDESAWAKNRRAIVIYR